ncbi:MAG: hypothetical protein GY866_22765 [Proteobacteria bacterium]|nr:hypothetical protein [Pseudomonadota bacterium]
MATIKKTGLVAGIAVCIVFSALEVYAFDGIKLRAAYFSTLHDVKGNGIDVNDGQVNKVPAVVGFPVVLVFEENLIGKSFYTQAFFDFELPYRSNDLAPSANADPERIKNEFLTAAEKALVESKTDEEWAVSADMKTQSVVLGYGGGWFYSTDGVNRWFKIGLGVNVGWFRYEMDLSLCLDGYEVKEQIQEDQSIVVSGECRGKLKIDHAEGEGLNGGLNGNITVYERKTSDSVFTAISYSLGTIRAATLDLENHKRRLDLPDTDLEVNLGVSFNYLELISYTWLF